MYSCVRVFKKKYFLFLHTPYVMRKWKQILGAFKYLAFTFNLFLKKKVVDYFWHLVDKVETPVRNPRPLCNRLNLQFDFNKTASKISS